MGLFNLCPPGPLVCGLLPPITTESATTLGCWEADRLFCTLHRMLNMQIWMAHCKYVANTEGPILYHFPAPMQLFHLLCSTPPCPGTPQKAGAFFGVYVRSINPAPVVRAYCWHWRHFTTCATVAWVIWALWACSEWCGYLLDNGGKTSGRKENLMAKITANVFSACSTVLQVMCVHACVINCRHPHTLSEAYTSVVHFWSAHDSMKPFWNFLAHQGVLPAIFPSAPACGLTCSQTKVSAEAWGIVKLKIWGLYRQQGLNMKQKDYLKFTMKTGYKVGILSLSSTRQAFVKSVMKIEKKVLYTENNWALKNCHSLIQHTVKKL